MSGDARWVEYEGAGGPGSGRKIVLVSGDEEYRSEEALPMLARMLAERHGFDRTVLFALDPRSGEIDPECQTNIPGLDHLDDADLLVLFTRFRELPDREMRHPVDFVERGGPVIGLRTATHAFAYKRRPDSPYARYSFDSDSPAGGFGRDVLGETWVAHHGDHGHESTRGLVPDGAASHPIVRGVEDVWGPSDVYAVNELPGDAEVLLLGQPLTGMSAGDPPNAAKTTMPVAWTRPAVGAGGSRVVCSTMGASVDLASEGLRRLLVNACYWCVGLEDAITERADVAIVGAYEPTMFGFGKHRVGLRPADLAT